MLSYDIFQQRVDAVWKLRILTAVQTVINTETYHDFTFQWISYFATLHCQTFIFPFLYVIWQLAFHINSQPEHQFNLTKFLKMGQCSQLSALLSDRTTSWQKQPFPGTTGNIKRACYILNTQIMTDDKFPMSKILFPIKSSNRLHIHTHMVCNTMHNVDAVKSINNTVSKRGQDWWLCSSQSKNKLLFREW